MLETHEIELLASLKDNGGYILLLERLEAEIAFYLDKVEHATNRFDEDRDLNLWRAMRKIYTVLKLTPQDMGRTLEEMAAVPRSDMDQFDLQQYQAAMKFAERSQAAHLAMLAAENEVE